MPLKTLFLNPPSFENFDGGAGSRWPATREIESYWYPVWLAYPAGMLEGSRLLDAPPHHVSAEETIRIAKEYEFLVLFTSTPGFPGDIRLSEAIKAANPEHQDRLCRAARYACCRRRACSRRASVDFVVRREFDYAVTDFAKGKPLEEIRRSFVPQERQGRPQPGRAAGFRPRCPAQRDRHLQARPGCPPL